MSYKKGTQAELLCNSGGLDLPAQPRLSLTMASGRLSPFVSRSATGRFPMLLHKSGSSLWTPCIAGTLRGVTAIDSVRSVHRVCLLLPGGGGALWLALGQAVRAAVHRIASELGVAASELALAAGGGRMVVGGERVWAERGVASEDANRRSVQSGTGCAAPLVARARRRLRAFQGAELRRLCGEWGRHSKVRRGGRG
jgi:hypothetical protein